jgi:hypothetical protein
MSLVIVKNNVPEMGLFKSAIKEEHQIVDYTSELKAQNVVDLIGTKTHLAFVYHFDGSSYVPFYSDPKVRPEKQTPSEKPVREKQVREKQVREKPVREKQVREKPVREKPVQEYVTPPIDVINKICPNKNLINKSFLSKIKMTKNNIKRIKDSNIQFNSTPPKIDTNKTKKTKTVNIGKKYFSNNIIDLFTQIKNKNGSLTVDLICCSLNNPDFAAEVSKLENDLGIDIRYSVDLTGNQNGNWMLESDSVDIKSYYFNETINQWNHVLTGAITLEDLETYKNFGNNEDYYTITKVGDVYTCKLLKDINISDIQLNAEGTTFFNSSDCFIRLKKNEVFDGNGKSIDVNFGNLGLFAIDTTDITGNTEYPLITNLTINSNEGISFDTVNGATFGGGGFVRKSQSNCKINNSRSFGNMLNSNNGLNWGSGGICGYNCNNCIITNCSSVGDINGNFAGGICGESCDDCTITNCSSVGDINGNLAGGICGYSCDNCTIENCSSVGDINRTNAGGICGQDCDGCTITNCSSVGDINGNFAGGICGEDCDNCTITNCSSVGDINGEAAGGICGRNCNNCTITNCSSVGDINRNNAGGICGSDCDNCTITNCSSVGDINGDFAGGICGRSCDDCAITNCSSVGDINGEKSGGICGDYMDNCLVKNSYSIGDINGNFAGGIFGAYSQECVIDNCYSIGNIIGNHSGGLFGAFSSENYDDDDGAQKCLVSNSYFCGNIVGTGSGGIFGGFVGGDIDNLGLTPVKSKSYIFNSYCNGKVIGSLTEGAKVYINSITTEDANIAITVFDLTDITKKIDTANQEEGVAVSLSFTISGGTNTFTLAKWDTDTIWVSGGIESTDKNQYPRLLIYQNFNNTATPIDLAIDSRLFLGLNRSERNTTRRLLVEKYANDNPIDVNDETTVPLSSQTALGFSSSLIYTKSRYYVVNEATEINLDEIIHPIFDELASNYGLYIANIPAGGTTITSTRLSKDYVITKTANNPNKYKIEDDNDIAIVIRDNLSDNDIFILESIYRIVFGSLTIMEIVPTNNPQNIGNYITAFTGEHKNNQIELNVFIKPKQNDIKNIKIFRYNGLCKTGTRIANFCIDKQHKITYIDKDYGSCKLIKYSLEVTLKNGTVLKTNKLCINLDHTQLFTLSKKALTN